MKFEDAYKEVLETKIEYQRDNDAVNEGIGMRLNGIYLEFFDIRSKMATPDQRISCQDIDGDWTKIVINKTLNDYSNKAETFKSGTEVISTDRIKGSLKELNRRIMDKDFDKGDVNGNHIFYRAILQAIEETFGKELI